MTYIHKLVDVPVLGNLPVQYIIFEGKKDVEPVPKHWHAALEVNCVLRGQASVYMAGQTYLMQAGDALAINSFAVHAGQILCHAEADYRIITFLYPIERLYALIPNYNALVVSLAPSDERTPAQQSAYHQLYQAFDLFYQLEQGEPPFFRIDQQALCYQILYLLFKNFSARRAPDTQYIPNRCSHPQLYEVVDYILKHYMEPLHRDQIAKACGYSTRHLANRFKATYQLSLMQYVTRIQALKAMQLLQTTEQPLSWIAAKVGFSYPYALTKAFKHAFGLTPTEYRRLKLRRN
jgi:AraC-like DNA-binding protein